MLDDLWFGFYRLVSRVFLVQKNAINLDKLKTSCHGSPPALRNITRGMLCYSRLNWKGPRLNKAKIKKATDPQKSADDFLSVARRLGCDEDKAKFEKKLGKIARAKVADKKPAN
jgi:hypothetical protein